MSKSLLFIPDISGFTSFVQSTESEHAEHVISELLEVLIDSNILQMELAEVEGDALFYYLPELPQLDQLLKQIENTFTKFYSHLEVLRNHRICPCNACITAPDLELKIIIHCADLRFINVQGKQKPFGPAVIEAHRLLKNDIDSNTYALISNELASELSLDCSSNYDLYEFKQGEKEYDGQTVRYLYSPVDKEKLQLIPAPPIRTIEFDRPPNLSMSKEFPVSATKLLEYITNYNFRPQWVKGTNGFEFNEHEVTRVGTEHVCVINSKKLNFEAITKKGAPGQFIYGEYSKDIPIADEIYQYYIISPTGNDSSNLTIEIYTESESVFKRLSTRLLKNVVKKNTMKALDNLLVFVTPE